MEHMICKKYKMCNELKPCPLCGREAIIQDAILYTDGGICMKIVCSGCGLTLSHKQEFVDHEIKDPATGIVIWGAKIALNESAIDLWNKRV